MCSSDDLKLTCSGHKCEITKERRCLSGLLLRGGRGYPHVSKVTCSMSAESGVCESPSLGWPKEQPLMARNSWGEGVKSG